MPVVPLGRSFPTWANGSVANIGLPVDVTSRLERILVGGAFDLVHVHEPIAPSLSFTAIREARSPVVATFHSTPVGLLGYELGHRLLGRFYERLDGRVVTSARAAPVLRDFFGGEYRVVPAGTRLVAFAGRRESPGQGLYVYRGDDRRGLRAFLRALATALPPGHPERGRGPAPAVGGPVASAAGTSPAALEGDLGGFRRHPRASTALRRGRAGVPAVSGRRVAAARGLRGRGDGTVRCCARSAGRA